MKGMSDNALTVALMDHSGAAMEPSVTLGTATLVKIRQETINAPDLLRQ